MPKEISYIRTLTHQDRVRVNFETKKGVVTKFIVQYETFIEEKWQAIIRYDTVHGFAHLDILHPEGKSEKITLYLPDYNAALTYAETDIKINWENYRDKYLKEMIRK